MQNICNYLLTTEIYRNAHSDSALGRWLILITFCLHFSAVTMICDSAGVNGSMQFLNPDLRGGGGDWLLPFNTDDVHYYLVWTIQTIHAGRMKSSDSNAACSEFFLFRGTIIRANNCAHKRSTELALDGSINDGFHRQTHLSFKAALV